MLIGGMIVRKNRAVALLRGQQHAPSSKASPQIVTRGVEIHGIQSSILRDNHEHSLQFTAPQR